MPVPDVLLRRVRSAESPLGGGRLAYARTDCSTRLAPDSVRGGLLVTRLVDPAAFERMCLSRTACSAACVPPSTPPVGGTACVTRGRSAPHGLHPTQSAAGCFDTRLAFRQTVAAEDSGSVAAGRDGAALAPAWASPPALNASRAP